MLASVGENARFLIEAWSCDDMPQAYNRLMTRCAADFETNWTSDENLDSFSGVQIAGMSCMHKNSIGMDIAAYLFTMSRKRQLLRLMHVINVLPNTAVGTVQQ